MKQRMYNSLPLLQDLVPLNYRSTNQGFILMCVFSSCPSVAT
ncbi:hypothetical protein [Phocaeicola dorei]|nr:hypothetical protein [Phocaeicola dorei]